MAAGGKLVRIGGASGFWGDSSVGAPQLVRLGNVDYLVFDYLAELTMSVLAAARAKDPALGYATDFVTVTMKAVLRDVVAQGIRVISNAGGVNPQACASALRALAAEQGLEVAIGVVQGDDVMPLVPQLRAGPVGWAAALPTDAAAGKDTVGRQAAHPTERLLLPDRLLTANAYLGALPIKQALDDGAQIVITGRCVDSAVTLGALMHEFGWAADDYGLLAHGSLAGHIIECGCQATGGLHTDWEAVPDWAHIGYPVIECGTDGSFVVGKPPGTGGLVNTAVVAEQMLYEIGDPQRYLLPDVTCDFSAVTLKQLGEHRVEVRGARGLAPGPSYKVSATFMDGFRCGAQLTIVGFAAARKARRTGEAILERTRELFARHGLPDYSRTNIEVLGSEEANYGPHARTQGVREAVLRVAVMHPHKAALDLFAREIAPAGTSWSPGTTGADGRPRPTAAIKQFGFLLDKQRVQPEVVMGGRVKPVAVPSGQSAVVPPVRPFVRGAQVDGRPQASTSSARTVMTHPVRPEPVEGPEPTIEVPLIRVAWGRSGDKGDCSNIGIIARRPEWLPLLRHQLTEERVASWLGHLVKGSVTRFDVPGIHALNFLCTQALDGGGMASLRNDPLGKGMAQILLAMPVRVPAHWGVQPSGNPGPSDLRR